MRKVKIECVKYTKEVRRVQIIWAFFLFNWLAKYYTYQMRSPTPDTEPVNISWRMRLKWERNDPGFWTDNHCYIQTYSELLKYLTVAHFRIKDRIEMCSLHTIIKMKFACEFQNRFFLATEIWDWFFKNNVKCQLFPSITAFLEPEYLPVPE